jgi:hypothetical protein
MEGSSTEEENEVLPEHDYDEVVDILLVRFIEVSIS